MQIITWQTYKKRYKPEIYQVTDSTKGWVRTTIQPTMRRAGFKELVLDIQHDKRKPKHIVFEDLKAIIEKSSTLVYWVYEPTGSYAGYFKNLEVYYLEKDMKEILEERAILKAKEFYNTEEGKDKDHKGFFIAGYLQAISEIDELKKIIQGKA